MELEDAVFAMFLVGALAVSFRRPKIAALTIVALSIGSYHKNFSEFVAGAPWILLFLVPLSIAVLRQSRIFVESVLRQTVSIWIFFGFTFISTIFALDISVSSVRLWELCKLLASMTLVFAIMRTRMDVEALVGVMALVMVVYGCVVGPYLLLTNSEPLTGPPDSWLFDRNDMAAALVTSVPLLFWLARSSTNRWAKIVLYLAVLTTCVSVLGTYSRGGFIALSVMLLMLSALGRNKWVTASIAVVVLCVGLYLMPVDFIERIITIKSFNDDDSALGRLAAWRASFAVAMDRIFGGGYEFHKNAASFALYSRTPPLATHSIYFQTLGEHGFVGLVLYLYVLVESLVLIAQTALQANRTGDRDLESLAFCLLTSISAFLVAGAFLSLAYWDGLFLLAFAVRILAAEAAAGQRKLQSKLGRNQPHAP